METANTVIYEPFIGHFTGQLSIISTKSGHTCRFKKPYPRIERHRHYMLKINVATGQVNFLVVVVPEDV